MSGAIKATISGLLIAAYPLIIYWLLSNQGASLSAVLVIGIILWKLRNRKDWFLWCAGAVSLALLVAVFFDMAAVSKMSPTLIHAALLYVFSQSLKNIPLIEQFARLHFDSLPVNVALYCKNVTILWCVFFAMNIAFCMYLALWGDDKMWMLYNGLIVYILVSGLLVGEYIWRRFAFPDMEIPSVADTIRVAIKSGHKVWGSGKQEDVSV